MKVVVGIDSQGHYKPTLRLLNRLDLPLSEVILAHCIEDLASAPPIAGAGSLNSEPVHDTWQEAHAAVAEACDYAKVLSAPCRPVIRNGSAADELINLAQHEAADLIAVRSERKGAFRSFFFGSVSRGLAIASPCSLLISKGELNEQSPLRLVFATDHSSFAAAALDQLIQWNPNGIASIHVVSAVSMSDYMFWATHFDAAETGEDREAALQAKFRELNEGIVARLTAEGYIARGSTPVCPVSIAIGDAMASADLLVMGAQGHGFVERLLIGSNSLHQVMIEPYPVLLLRPKVDNG